MTIQDQIKVRGIRVSNAFHHAVVNSYVGDLKQVVFILAEDNGEKILGYDAKSTLFIICQNRFILERRQRDTREYLEELELEFKEDITNRRIILL